MFKTTKKIIRHIIESSKSVTTINSSTKITINGKNIDPKSKRGEKIVKASDEVLEDMENVMNDMSKTMDKFSKALK
jgi:methyl-accepting chemotaxis protein